MISSHTTQVAVAAEDGVTYVYHMTLGRIHRELKGHRLRVNAVAFHSDCTWMATGSSDKTLCLWHAETGLLRNRLQVQPALHSFSSPDAAHLSPPTLSVSLVRV